MAQAESTGLGFSASRSSRRAVIRRLGDSTYRVLIAGASLSVLALILAIGLVLWSASRESIGKFGTAFFVTSKWDAAHQIFGALPFILGTLYTSFWALFIAVPISVGAAIFLAEIAPPWIRTPCSYLIELLAAVPSVVYGLWGVFVLSPWLVQHFETPVSQNDFLSKLFLFTGAPNGNDFLAGSLILSIMVIPFVTAISRDIIRAIPNAARDGSYALGATRWETIRGVVLPYARSGIVGATVLGLGRALGETMAVTMVIGNFNGNFAPSLFSPGATMTTLIVNEFQEASQNLYISAIIEIGLALFVVSVIVNGAARILIRYTAKNLSGASVK